eukprot:g39212.t1
MANNRVAAVPLTTTREPNNLDALAELGPPSLGPESARSRGDAFSPLLQGKRRKYSALCIGLVLIIVALIAVIIDPTDCLLNNLKQPVYKTEENMPVGEALLLRRCTIWTGLGNVIPDADILLSEGLITKIGASGERLPSLNVRPDQVIDVQGRVVTPGLVDLHSHLGVSSWPDLDATDANEMTDPILPQVRALDAINPEDQAMPRARAGGVTTVTVLPGSANLMGGEAVVLKLRSGEGGRSPSREAGAAAPPRFPQVQDLLLSNAPRVLKMACGENPKRVYGRQGQMPSTRMGTTWLMRQAFEEARAEMLKQEEWCSKESNQAGSFPRQLRLDGLVALLRGEALLMNHCFATSDLEIMMRLSDEFGFRVSTFHHASQAYKLASQIAARNTSIATFATLWGFTLEGYDASVYAPAALHEAGVNLVLKSDHPVLDSRFLIFEAAKAHRFSLPAQAAVASVTYNPAKALGLANRIGSVQERLEADLVVWDTDPLVLGAEPTLVIIDGVIRDRKDAPLPADRTNSSLLTAKIQELAGTACQSSQPVLQLCTVLRDVLLYSNDGPARQVQRAVIRNGVWDCIGSESDCPLISGCSQYSLGPGTGFAVLIPGLVEGISELGQSDIDVEIITKNGANPGAGISSPGLAAYMETYVWDGLRLDSRHLRAAWRAGIVGVTSKPQGNALVAGLTASFPTCCHDLHRDLTVMQHANALYLQLGNPVKSASAGSTASYSGQIASLRALLRSWQKKVNNSADGERVGEKTTAELIMSRELPLMVQVDAADLMLPLLQLQREYQFRLIIAGAAEAWMLAKELAAAGDLVSVLLTTRPMPASIESQRVRDDAFRILVEAGVKKVGLSTAANEMVARELIWEAGLMQKLAGVSTAQAIAAVTSAPASMLGMDKQGFGFIRPGNPAHYAVFNGEPLQLQSEIQLVGSGTFVQCMPKQI